MNENEAEATSFFSGGAVARSTFDLEEIGQRCCRQADAIVFDAERSAVSVLFRAP